jgi:hypothetical protein
MTRLSVLFAALGLMLVAAAPAGAQSWQYSYQPDNRIGREFRIGIRSKFGETPYWATFIVTAPGGRDFSRTIRVVGDAWGHLTYPRDFGAPARPGAYTYVIVVGGKVALSAKFRLR